VDQATGAPLAGIRVVRHRQANVSHSGRVRIEIDEIAHTSHDGDATFRVAPDDSIQLQGNGWTLQEMAIGRGRMTLSEGLSNELFLDMTWRFMDPQAATRALRVPPPPQRFDLPRDQVLVVRMEAAPDTSGILIETIMRGQIAQGKVRANDPDFEDRMLRAVMLVSALAGETDVEKLRAIARKVQQESLGSTATKPESGVKGAISPSP
jgi:hypothetical protein